LGVCLDGRHSPPSQASLFGSPPAVSFGGRSLLGCQHPLLLGKNRVTHVLKGRQSRLVERCRLLMNERRVLESILAPFPVLGADRVSHKCIMTPSWPNIQGLSGVSESDREASNQDR
jgi:hypothetical protein